MYSENQFIFNILIFMHLLIIKLINCFHNLFNYFIKVYVIKKEKYKTSILTVRVTDVLQREK